jgi:hypothetical protein
MTQQKKRIRGVCMRVCTHAMACASMCGVNVCMCAFTHGVVCECVCMHVCVYKGRNWSEVFPRCRQHSPLQKHGRIGTHVTLSM